MVQMYNENYFKKKNYQLYNFFNKSNLVKLIVITNRQIISYPIIIFFESL